VLLHKWKYLLNKLSIFITFTYLRKQWVPVIILFLYFQARALQEKREAIDKQKKKEKKKQKTSS